MKNPETHLYTLWRKQRRLRIQLVVVLLVCVALFLWLRPHIFQGRPAEETAETTSAASVGASGTLEKGTPTYDTLTPDGGEKDWTRVSPPEHNPVYAFTDTVQGVSIIVSEQPLPDDFKDNTQSKLGEFATNYNANRFITVDDTVVYIGTSSKGPQSLIMTKDSLLILIKSTTSLNDEQWTAYIHSLR